MLELRDVCFKPEGLLSIAHPEHSRIRGADWNHLVILVLEDRILWTKYKKRKVWHFPAPGLIWHFNPPSNVSIISTSKTTLTHSYISSHGWWNRKISTENIFFFMTFKIYFLCWISLANYLQGLKKLLSLNFILLIQLFVKKSGLASQLFAFYTFYYENICIDTSQNWLNFILIVFIWCFRESKILNKQTNQLYIL